MQAVNEAWRVLGDSRLRREYDRTLRRAAPPPVAPPSPAAPVELDDAPAPDTIQGTPVQLALRVMPWVVIALVILGIFVFTAYATPDTSGTDSAGSAPDAAPVDGGPGWLQPGVCILLLGDTVAPVSCESTNDGLVVQDEVGPSGCRDETADLVEIPSIGRRVCVVDTLATRQ